MKKHAAHLIAIILLQLHAFGDVAKTVTADRDTGALMWPTNFWDVEAANIYFSLGLSPWATNQTALLWRKSLELDERTTNGTSLLWRQSLGLDERVTNNTAALWRGSFGFDVSAPGAFGTNILTQSASGGARSLLGLDAGAPGSVGTNVLTQATAGGVRSLLGLDAGAPGAAGTNLITQATTGSVRSLLGLDAGAPGAVGTNLLLQGTVSNARDLLGVTGATNGVTRFMTHNSATNTLYWSPTTLGEIEFMGAGGTVNTAIRARSTGSGWPALETSSGSAATNASPSDAALLNYATAKAVYGAPGSIGTNLLTQTTASKARMIIGSSLQIAANGNQMQWEQVVASSFTDNRVCGTRWYCPVTVRQPRLFFLNAGRNSSTEGRSDQVSVPSLTICASVQIDSGPIFYTTFGGYCTNATLPPNGYLISDPIPVTVTNGSWINVRTFSYGGSGYRFVCSSGNGMAIGSYRNASGSGEWDGSHDGYADVLVGTFSAGNSVQFGPHTILGEVDSPTFAIFGDSTSGGSSSAGEMAQWLARLGGVTMGAGGGPWRRAIGATYPIANLGIPGVSLSSTMTNCAYRAQLASRASVIVDGLGVNDLNAGTTTNTLITMKTAWWNYLKSLGAQKIVTTTFAPIGGTSATNNWINTNSTPGAAWATVASYNAWVRANYASYVDALVDLEQLETVGIGTGIWKPATAVDGGTLTSATSNYAFTDTTKTWTVGQWTGRSVYVVVSGTTNATICTSNSVDTIYLSRVDSMAGGQAYTLCDNWTQDGTHPTATANAYVAASISNALPAIVYGVR